jgi:hypothetical protein
VKTLASRTREIKMKFTREERRKCKEIEEILSCCVKELELAAHLTYRLADGMTDEKKKKYFLDRAEEYGEMSDACGFDLVRRARFLMG